MSKYNFVVTIELDNEDVDVAESRVVSIYEGLAEVTKEFLKNRTDVKSWKGRDEFITFEPQDTLQQQNKTVIVELNYEIVVGGEISTEKHADLQDKLFKELDKSDFWDRYKFGENEGVVGLEIYND